MSTATELLVGASTDFLRRFSPFNRMEADALAFLAENAVLGFHPQGSVLLEPASGVARNFFIVQRGKIQARQFSSGDISAFANLALGPGECFPIGAVSAGRPSTNTYIAVEDSFCFQISAEHFLQLMQMSAEFHLFCTRYIASLLSQSREQLLNSFSQRAAEQQTMTTTLQHLLKHAPVAVGPDTPTREALERMNAARVRSMVVVDGEGRAVGIFTHGDLLPRVVLPGIDLQRPIHEVMTVAPRQLPASAAAYDAVLEMAAHGVRHLLVADSDGRFLGVVSERDLFALQRISLRQIRATIEHAEDLDALRLASSDIRQLALNLIAQGIGAEQLTQFISTLNDALTSRIIAIALERHDLSDIDFAWVAFGSEGRHEQTLATDQDNGIIWENAADQDTETVRQRLLTFASEVNNDLAACGFPLCDGNIMASNPELCLTLDEWRSRFGSWMREPHPQALLNASIFFDFRILYGNARHGDRLRRWLNRSVRGDAAFLRLMASNALQVLPPLGRIRDFVVDADGLIDLKKYGVRVFVDVARIFGLRMAVDASSTAARLRQAGSRMGVSSEELAAIIDGFHFIQLLRLRAQNSKLEEGDSAGNRIDPEELNELDRRILKESFRQARKLQLRLKLDYQL